LFTPSLELPVQLAMKEQAKATANPRRRGFKAMAPSRLDPAFVSR